MKETINEIEHFNDGEWGSDDKPLKYKGTNLFNLYINNHMSFVNDIKENVYMYDDDVVNFDSQECYLGYNINEDTFISCHDTWFDYEDGYRENGYSSIVFKIIDGIIKVEFVETLPGNIFYNSTVNGYNALKKEKHIIDIRLD